VKTFVPNCWSVTFVASGQEAQKKLWMPFISFLFSKALKYVLYSHMEVHGQLLFFRPFQWIQHIVARRAHYDEDVAGLNDINDVRNGMVTNPLIHRSFDRRTVVVLKVCHI
jgi:hypothetical protein